MTAIVGVDQVFLLLDCRFSTDEGQCWHLYNFTDSPVYFTGLATEPGARSMNVSIWGYRESYDWVSFTIDFRELLTRDCEWSTRRGRQVFKVGEQAEPDTSARVLAGGDDDYVIWLAHSDDISDPNDGCILGYKEKFRRLRKDSVCWNGRDYVVNTMPTPCPCTLDDFLW